MTQDVREYRYRSAKGQLEYHVEILRGELQEEGMRVSKLEKQLETAQKNVRTMTAEIANFEAAIVALGAFND